MLGFNGGLIGKTQTTSTSKSLPGMWTLTEHLEAVRSGSWPVISSDPDFDKVSLLLSMNGSNGSTTFTDSSSNAFAVTAFGNAQVTTTDPKFGTGSLTLDGTGDYLTLPANAAFQFGTGDFTVECWVYVNNGSSNQGLFTFGTAGSGLAVLVYLGNWYLTTIGSGGPALGGVTTGTWQHLAVTRSGSSLRMFINGIQLGSTLSNSTNLSDNALKIGYYYSTAFTINARIDDFRVTKGLARYTSNFTPPGPLLTIGSVILATGGDTTSDISVGGVNYRVHTFSSTGPASLVVSGSVFIEYLVIAGGGGAGGRIGGGGGAGGYRCSVVGESSGGGASAESQIQLVNGTYTITVGAGGAGGNSGLSNDGTNGQDSSIAGPSIITVTSTGGGGGAGTDGRPGKAGGSGGGGGRAVGGGPGGAATANQGFAGGASTVSGSPDRSGGGGGAGVAGATGLVSGNGGNGIASAITGTLVTRGGGGGGAAYNTSGGAGGTGGGGSSSDKATGITGTVNTGGGGGGGGTSNTSSFDQPGGAGGSGIVIIRYLI